MATWSAVLASGIAGQPVRHVCSSGTLIYYIDTNQEDVYEYNPDTNTETKIIDASTLGIAVWSIAWFNDDLYLFTTATGPTLEVRRWTGSVNGVTTVKNFDLSLGDDFAGASTGMITDGNVLVAFALLGVDVGGECWYSANGSSWSAGSWSVTVYHPSDLNGVLEPLPQTSFPTGLFWEFVTDADETFFPNDTTVEKSIFQFSGGSWSPIAALNTNPNGVYKLSSPNDGVHWTYTNGEYYISSAFAATDTTTISPITMYQVNMPFSVALDTDSENLYQFDGLEWVALDTFSVSWDLTPTGQPCMVRLDNGDCYIIAYASAGAGYDTRIFARDTPIITTTSAGFYYGRGGLQRRADLPFGFLNIGGLAVAAPFAILGNGESEVQMVVYAGPADTYASFTNFTGSLSDDPIMAFDATPYGSAAGAEESGADSGPGGGLSDGKC